MLYQSFVRKQFGILVAGIAPRQPDVSPDQSRAPARSPQSVRRLSRTHPDTLRCVVCSVDLAFGSQVVSKGFTGRYGRAYLVSAPASPADRPSIDLVNVKVGKPENRQLVIERRTCFPFRAEI